MYFDHNGDVKLINNALLGLWPINILRVINGQSDVLLSPELMNKYKNKQLDFDQMSIFQQEKDLVAN